MESHKDGTLTLTAAEVTDLKELFDHLLAGRRLAAGYGGESQARYMRFMDLRRKLFEGGRP